MVILYKDKSAKNVTVTSNHMNGPDIKDSLDLVEKVVHLERKLTENQQTMEKLKKKVEVLQKVYYNTIITISFQIFHT